jgi:hypothetical protein
MDMDEAAEVGRKACRGKAGKGLVHDGNGAYLFLGEFVRPFEVIDLYLAGIGGRAEIFRFRIPGVNSGKKLINLFLR